MSFKKMGTNVRLLNMQAIALIKPIKRGLTHDHTIDDSKTPVKKRASNGTKLKSSVTDQKNRKSSVQLAVIKDENLKRYQTMVIGQQNGGASITVQGRSKSGVQNKAQSGWSGVSKSLR